MSLVRFRRVPLADRLALDAALAEAFAPLRRRQAPVGPARVHAALRWAAPAPRPFAGLAILGRLSELAVAAAVSAFLFSAAMPVAAPQLPDASRDPVSQSEWTLNGRIALQRPIDSRATDYRTIAGDGAANAAIVRRRAAEAAPPLAETELLRAH